MKVGKVRHWLPVGLGDLEMLAFYSTMSNLVTLAPYSYRRVASIMDEQCSQDLRIIQGWTCEYKVRGISASFNNGPERLGQIVLNNVTFSDFMCDSKIIEFYQDSLLEDDMGDPVESSDVTILSSDESSLRARPFIKTSSWKTATEFSSQVAKVLVSSSITMTV